MKKKYEARRGEPKRKFVEEVVSPLLRHANTGFYGAEYVCDSSSEYYSEVVWLLDNRGERIIEVNVSCDSLEEIVRDIFKAMKDW